MQVRVLGAHNLETRETRHTCLLIDGVLGLDAGSLVSALTPAELSKVRAVLLTHQHFDHIRDVPSLGLATLDESAHIDVYGLPETLDSVRSHLMDGVVYPDLTEGLNEAAPKYRFQPVKPEATATVLGYAVTALPVPHPVPAVGYIVRAPIGHCVAYTGDTGGNIGAVLHGNNGAATPEVLFVDVTFPDRLEKRAKITGHLTPGLLGAQLRKAGSSVARLPRIVPVHLSMSHRDEVRRELTELGAVLGVSLTPGYEEMVV